MKRRSSLRTLFVPLAFAMVLGILLNAIGASVIWAAPRLARTQVQPSPTPKSSCSTAAIHETSFNLDGVTVSVHTPYLPAHAFDVARSADASQVATSDCWNPFRELAITAIPFGTTPGTEALPSAHSGDASLYRAALFVFRAKQGAHPYPGPAATLFGQQVSSEASMVTINLNDATLHPTLIVEWIVEAGPRLWIVRFSEEQTPQGMISLAALAGLRLSSTTLYNPSTLAPQHPAPAQAPAASKKLQPYDLSNPSWWSGTCDTNNYSSSPQNPQHIAAYPLGASYNGMLACGPRPYYNEGPDVTVHFFQGAWGVLEWECVELVMRYMYMQYNINPYPGNGSQVVWNYTQYNPNNPTLQVISNNTQGQAPQVGDIMSYGPVSSAGHTSVVTASSVDGNGNGTLTVIEENASQSGTSQVNVSNWVVGSGVTGWLHHPQSGPPGAPNPTTSRYMSTVDPGTLTSEGCSQAQAGESGMIILDFGSPAIQNGVYGTDIFSNNFASTADIASAAEAFLQGFSNCKSSGQAAILALGTSNYGSVIANVSTATSHGQAWGQMVESVEQWVKTNKYKAFEVALGASDMELDWNSPAPTKAWAKGYATGTDQYYLDYGDAAGCPPYGQCNNGWSQADVVYVAWGAKLALPFPEIYNTTGANAQQWQSLSLYAFEHTHHKMNIQGALTQYAACQQHGPCPGTDNTPQQGWTQLSNALNADKRTKEKLYYSSDISWAN